MIVDVQYHKAGPQQFQRVISYNQTLHTIVLAFYEGHEHTIPVKEVKGIRVSND